MGLKDKEVEEGVVVGDSGGDATNIATGELSGNIVIANTAVKKARKSEKKDKKNRNK